MKHSLLDVAKRGEKERERESKSNLEAINSNLTSIGKKCEGIF